MADKSEMEVILDKFAIEMAGSLKELLQKFRDICYSGEEFSQRMYIVSQDGMPNLRQYYFDGIAVFYTISEFSEDKLQFTVYPGKAIG